jgi:hypothetical protein
MKFKDSNGDHPSQRQHNCLMMDEYEWWQMYGLEWFRSGHESIKTGGWQRCTWIFAAKYYLTKRKLTFNGKQIFSNKWCLVFTCSIASKPYICYRWYSFIIRQSCCRWLGWSIWQPLHDSLQTILNFMRYCIRIYSFQQSRYLIVKSTSWWCRKTLHCPILGLLR